MEELQDAIEDAQYINAMQDDTPRPTKEWRFPGTEEVNAYIAKVEGNRPILLRPEGFCAGSLGLYMYSKFIREQGDNHVAAFLIDVATYRQSKVSSQKLICAQKIYADYIIDGSTGNPHWTENRKSSTYRYYPGMRQKRASIRQTSFTYTSPHAAIETESSSVTLSDGSSDRSLSVASVHATNNSDFINPIVSQAQGGSSAVTRNETSTSSTSSASSSQWTSSAPPLSVPITSEYSSVYRSENNSSDTKGAKKMQQLHRISRQKQSTRHMSSVTFGGIDDEAIVPDIGLDSDAIPQEATSTSSTSIDPASSPSAYAMENWAEFMVGADRATNILCVAGEPVIKVKTFFSSLANTSASSSSGSGVAFQQHLLQQLSVVFDEVENIIFYSSVAKHWQQFSSSSYWMRYWQFMTMSEHKVQESDFALFRVLGRGGFGMVNGCKRCYSGKLFAIKMMNKKRVKMKKAEALCLNERNILAVVDSPFVVCLKYAFDTPSDLYLVLDLMIGGDLGFHLSARKTFTVPEAKYFAARMLMGVAALHELNIVYRDLKPENVLMDESGLTKISDLGLACRVGRSGLSGTCGTRGYWAPEMLKRDANGKRERYGLSVDWFSFGCCIYEFIHGVGPFRVERARHWGNFPKVEKTDKDRAIDLAIQEMEPEFSPVLFDPVLQDLLKKLLNKDGKTRLGAKGASEIMQHPWFSEIDFDNLNNITPPIKPNKDINMASQSDIGSFPDDKESRKIVLSEADTKMYEHWQFTSNRSFQEEVVGFLLFEEIHGPIQAVDHNHVCCCSLS